MSYQLSSALRTANRVVEILTPVCDRIHIAGSIRRQRAEVKDIEIVCQPKKIFKPDLTDLFNQGEWMVSPDFDHALSVFTERIVKGKSTGRMMQIILKGGKPLDLFMPDPDDYFRQLVIRTGSADYVHSVIATAWRQHGWCGAQGKGLRLMSECTSRVGSDQKTVWTCNHPKPTLPPVWQSEEEVFAWLGLPYAPPECRELKTSMDYSR